MADLLARILFNDKEFNDGLKRSKQQVEQFNAGVDKLKVGLARFAGAVGVATTAGAAFARIIDSTQSLTDSFNSSMEAAKASVDYFFDSIAISKFDGFLSGLRESAVLARELYDAMDTLGDMQAGWSDVESELKTKINQNIAEIYDTETTLERKKELIEENKRMIGELEAKGRRVADQLAEAAVKAARNESHLSDISEADVKRYLQEISTHADEEFYNYVAKRKELEQRTREVTAVSSTTGAAWQKTGAAKNAEAELAALKANNTEMEKFYRINELISDTRREDIVALRAQGRAIDSNLASLSRQNSMVERRVLKQGGKGETEKVLEGSIAEIEEKLKEAKKAFANATTDEARRTADTLIKELEKKKAVIEFEMKYTGGIPANIMHSTSIPAISGTRGGGKPSALREIAALEAQRAKLEKSIKMTVDVDDINKLQKQLKEVDSSIDTLQEVHGLKIQAPENIGRALNINRADITDGAVEGINGVSDALHSVSTMLEENKGAWLEWGSGVLSSIAAAIPAITALTVARTAEANANANAAASGAAAATASIPVVGPILAVAAVASVIAAIMAAPKFELGGIVGGSSYSGDNLLVRVNSGEMILNSAQQRNLFAMLNGGAGGGSGNNEIRLRLVGRDLVAAITQEQLKMRRI